MMEELTGRPADPQCLHCVLPPVIDQFWRAFPNKAAGQIQHELLQVLSEFMASQTEPSQLEGALIDACEQLQRLTRQAAAGIRRAGLIPGTRKRPQ